MSKCNCNIGPEDVFDHNFETINYDCPKTWDLISRGDVGGCFQLESRLGKKTAKRVQPHNIEELSDIISIIRPGCLEAVLEDGKSVTDHYILRKNKEESVSYFHPALEPLLSDTYGLMLYQEQMMAIATELAGFTLVESDDLRRAAGKKKVELMQSMRKKFIDGCLSHSNISEENSSVIFDWIEKSQRYSFNKCLSPATKVELEDGTTKKLKDVKVGDMILCPEVKGQKFFKVLDVIDNGLKDIYRIESRGGVLHATRDHKCQVKDGRILPVWEICRDGLKVRFKKGFYKISDTMFVGCRESMDIEVDHPEHLFYGDGFAVSNSHSVSYACISYMTAYAKTHFPHRFFTSYLNHAKDKPAPFEEIDRLITDAQRFGIYCFPPDIRKRNKDFATFNKRIHFGLGHIKGIGEKTCDDIIAQIPDDIGEMTWPKILFDVLLEMKKSAVKSFIGTGAFDYLNFSRKKLLYEHDQVVLLNKKEIDYIRASNDLGSLEEVSQALTCLETMDVGRGCVVVNARRYRTVMGVVYATKSPSYSLKDTIEEIAGWEESYLGKSLTCSRLDSVRRLGTETDCGKFQDEFKKTFNILAQIKRVREVTTKAGESMAFCSISDKTGDIDDVVVFPANWAKYEGLINNLSILRLSGTKSNDSFILNHCEEP